MNDLIKYLDTLDLSTVNPERLQRLRLILTAMEGESSIGVSNDGEIIEVKWRNGDHYFSIGFEGDDYPHAFYMDRSDNSCFGSWEPEGK